MRKETKILIVAANPKDTSRLRLDEEVREIEEGLQRSQLRAQFNVKSKWAPRPKDLRRALLDEQPNILHFSGHGTTKGIILENSEGKAVVVAPKALEGLFNLFSDNLDCVVLNACYSESQANSIAKRIPHVIGMKEQITDEVALEFAVGFYDALGAGKSIEEAYKFGSNAIELLGSTNESHPMIRSIQNIFRKFDTESSANNVYRFRAECSADVDRLREAIGRKIDKITIVNSAPFPDVEVEILVDLSLEELRDSMRHIEDGHVMVQTVAQESEYTGERDYSL